jgi:hypothetical protein
VFSAPLVIPALVKPVGRRPLEAVDLSFQSGIPGDLPLHPQPDFQVFLILKADRNWGPKLDTLGDAPQIR